MDEIMAGIEALIAAAADDADAAEAEMLSTLADAVAAVADANPDAPETQPLKDALLNLITAMTAEPQE